MSIVPTVLDHLARPSHDIAIVGIDDIRTDHESVFDFIHECQRRTPNIGYTAEFIRPTERDDGTGDKIILMANPARIIEHNVLGTRIYIVEDTTALKRALIKYRVNP